MTSGGVSAWAVAWRVGVVALIGYLIDMSDWRFKAPICFFLGCLACKWVISVRDARRLAK